MKSDFPNNDSDESPDRIKRIVRQHAHDVRNFLNNLDLEAVILEESISDPETVQAAARMRSQLAQLEDSVQSLLFKFDDPRPIALAAGDLLQLWKRKAMREDLPGDAIEWSASNETESLILDPNVVVSVLCELTLTARKRSAGDKLKAILAKNSVGKTILELREPANDYPLSEDLIDEARRLIETNGGRLEHVQIPATKEWRTTLIFPGTPI